jgi:UDP-N-acetylglucosamine:LPS N-acetylglucosamine transferase
VARTDPARNGAAREDRVEVLLVASPGGHLLQLLALRPAWRDFSSAWVTLDRPDARSLLQQERVYFACGPTNRSIRNLLRNVVVARRLLRRLRPRVVITTGAGVAVPFAWLAHLAGARVIYVESLSRIDRASMSLRMISPVADRIYGQWPEFVEAVPRARFAGSVFAQ